jgi:hypothetical protein
MLHSWSLRFFTMWLLIGWGCASDSSTTAALASAETPPKERLYILGGKMDAGNLYPSAVLLSAPRKPREVGECSGVLISPRRVLTAAHCVCMEKPIVSPLQNARTLIDGSICLGETVVATAAYGRLPPEKRYPGVKVEPHPGLRLFYDEDGNLLFAESDLAVIHLESAIPGVPSVELAKKEVEPGSAVALVGFGDTELQEPQESRKRYFGRTEIAQVEGELLRVLKPGAHAYAGDSGGPCFKWEQGKANPVLVGIIRGGGAPVYSTITSTSFPRNRTWLEKIIREDMGASSTDSP